MVPAVGGEARVATTGGVLWSDGTSFVLTDLAGGSARPLPALRIAVEVAVSPGGTRIAFSAQGAIWLLDLASGTTKRLTAPSAADLRHLVWARDGRHVAFASGCRADPTPESWVYSVDVRNAHVTRYPNRRPGTPRPEETLDLAPVAWTPDSRALYYVESRYQSGRCGQWQALESTRLLRVAAGGQAPKPVLEAMWLGDAKLAPNGKQIAYAYGDTGDPAQCSFDVANGAGRLLRQVATVSDRGVDGYCWAGGRRKAYAWSPRSDAVLYANGRDVVAVNVATGRRTTVHKGPPGPIVCGAGPSCVGNRILAISGDGKWLLVVEIRAEHVDDPPVSERYRLLLAGADGKTSRSLRAPGGRTDLEPVAGWFR